ncbi:MAG: alpha/beta hydrolase, partial [Chloroflexota bacterium]
MPDPIPEPILSRAQVPSSNGRPVRKDEIELHDRGIYIESWLPERRSRRKPLMFVHGELAGSWVWERYLGYFAGRGWEGHAVNLRNHYWSQTADPAQLSFDTYLEDVVASLDRLGPTTVAIGHGMGGLLALKAAERVAISGLVLIGAALPRDLRPPVRAYELREVPEVFGRGVIGWETLPEKLVRDERDLTLTDVLRIQHLLGQKPHESGLARRQVLAGIPVDRRAVSDVPRLVIGGGLDRTVELDDAERLADWL